MSGIWTFVSYNIQPDMEMWRHHEPNGSFENTGWANLIKLAGFLSSKSPEIPLLAL